MLILFAAYDDDVSECFECDDVEHARLVTCKTLRARRMSPLLSVSIAFTPSGVTLHLNRGIQIICMDRIALAPVVSLRNHTDATYN